MDLGTFFLLTGVILILVGVFMSNDYVLHEIVMGICAACLLMIIGACLAMLVLHYVPAFFMLITHGHGVHEFV